MSKIQEWVDGLLMVARLKGEISAADEAAIREFVAGYDALSDGDVTFMEAMKLWVAYETWRAERDGDEDLPADDTPDDDDDDDEDLDVEQLLRRTELMLLERMERLSRQIKGVAEQVRRLRKADG